MREYYLQSARESLSTVQDPPIFLSPEQIISQSTPQAAKQEQNAIIRLSKSIEKYGVLEPLAVKPTNNSGGFALYELIDGERRYRAAAIAGVTKLPCIILPQSAPQCLQLAQIQRLLREKPHYFTLAEAFLQLINDYRMTQDEIARRMGLSQSAVANKIRLLRLTPDERRMITSYDLSERHARAFLQLSDSKMRAELITRAGQEALTVAKTEEMVLKHLQNRTETPKNREKTTDNTTTDPQGSRKALDGESLLFYPQATFRTALAYTDTPESITPFAPKDGVTPRKFALRDLKPLYNSIERTLGIFQKTGVAARYHKEEDENAARIVIYIPKRG